MKRGYEKKYKTYRYNSSPIIESINPYGISFGRTHLSKQ